jgi:hypothetical protein
MPTSRRTRSIDENCAALVFLQRVDAADHRGFAGAGRSANDDAFAAFDLQADVAQHMEVAEPLVHGPHLDRGMAGIAAPGGFKARCAAGIAPDKAAENAPRLRGL